ncbi:hypothetical protein GSI_02374 [Ganoderma sinense ZZ0214-1]|uniref:Uncharacterized protein n=1 Tax=Ganoderma sinense ZZ0214-1 TaxID=1077348 RepID=A0A2G8SPF9_9APHY|nr:hypothetical protein GSI_02374 [Ganoderma sinense ZZ0214-1]
MSLAAFLPLRSPHPHHRSPPDAFSPRMSFSPRPALMPMSRIRIETVSRRTNDLPRDPSDWVDKDLLSYVRYNYSPIEAVSLSEVIERDRLTPTALWYLQAEPEQLLAIAEEESLRDTLLGLALSLKPAVSPTSPRIRHVRRLSEDLERPPPPPPPPPPSPPTPEEPELEEDDDVAESVVSDWALDEDLGGNDGTTPTMVDLGDLAGSAGQPEPPLEGLGLHTGEPQLDNTTAPPPQPLPVDTDDLINLEDDAQPTVPPEEATNPHTTRADTDHSPAEEPASSQDASANAHVPDAAEEKPPVATPSADPSPPLDEASASQEAGAGVPADPFAGSPIEDDDLGNPWADSEDTTKPDPAPPPHPVDPARTATPTSDYHDANSIHSDEGERPEATPAEHEPEPSPVHAQQQEGAAMSRDEEQLSTETRPPAEAPIKGDPGSGDDAPPSEEVQQEETPPPTSEEIPIEPPPATDPVQTIPPDANPVQTTPPATGPAQTSPSVTDATQRSPSVPEPVPTRAEETARTQDEHVSPAADPEHHETAHLDQENSKDVHAEVPPAQSTTVTSGIPPSDQSQETASAESGESAHLGDEVRKVGEEAITQMGEETGDKESEGRDATVPAITTTESPEATVSLEASQDSLDNSPPLEGSSEGVVSGVRANAQSSTSETTQAVQPEAEVTSLTTQEETLEKCSTPLEKESSSPLADTTIDPTPAVTVIDPPPSPTVRLASGIEAQLIGLDPESTEQTPSASPGDTPPNESLTMSESRQASPPAETEALVETKAEKPLSPPLGCIPSSASHASSAEGKSPTPPRLNTAFGSLSEPSRFGRPSAGARTDNSAWQQSPASRSTLSPATAKTIGWGSAHSPAAKPPAWGRVLNSVTSFFAPPSESSTRESSQERETPDPRSPVSPAPAVRQSPWAKGKNWSAVASSSPSSLQESKSKQPPAPITELSVSVSPAQVSPPTHTGSDTKASVLPLALPFDSSLAEGFVIPESNPRTEDLTDVMSDSVLVDSGMPSAGNGEPVRDADASQDLPVQAVVSSQGDLPDVGDVGGKNEIKDTEDEDLVEVTADDAAGAEKEGGPESQPQGDVDVDEDEDENTPLNLRLDRVRQMTGDSMSSAATSDTETQGDEERPGGRRGPKLQTSGLASEPDGIGSPSVESPIVGTPTQSKARKRKNKKKKN